MAGISKKMLFKAADKLRKNIDAAEYKHVVLGLIFLKFISDSFEELHSKLVSGEGDFAGANPEDKDEYMAESVFFVPPNARWSYLQTRAKLPSIGEDLDMAMDLIEKDNPSLRGILPKVYARPNLDKMSLGGLIDMINNTALKQENEKSKDLFGRVYEYFLGEFANAEGKKGGNGERARTDEISFIDAKDLGHLIDRTHKVFSDEDIAKISGTYHQWKSKPLVVPAQAGIQFSLLERGRGVCCAIPDLIGNPSADSFYIFRNKMVE